MGRLHWRLVDHDTTGNPYVRRWMRLRRQRFRRQMGALRAKHLSEAADMSSNAPASAPSTVCRASDALDGLQVNGMAPVVLNNDVFMIIAQWIDRPDDLLAFKAATRLPLGNILFERIASRWRTRPEHLVEVGAPLYVVRRMYHMLGKHLSVDRLPMAARGGRLSVLHWILASPTDMQWAEYARDHRMHPTARFHVRSAGTEERGDEPWDEDGEGDDLYHLDRDLFLSRFNRDKTHWSADPVRHFKDALAEAARMGHVHVLRALLGNAHTIVPHSIVDQSLCDSLQREAVRRGQLSAVAFFHDIGRGKNKRLGSKEAYNCSCPLTLLDVIVECDSVEMLVWLYESGCSVSRIVREGVIRETALEKGATNIARWLVHTERNEKRKGWSVESLIKAAENDHADCIQVVHDLGACKCTLQVLLHAASAGSLGVIRWAATRAQVTLACPLLPVCDACKGDTIDAGTYGGGDDDSARPTKKGRKVAAPSRWHRVTMSALVRVVYPEPVPLDPGVWNTGAIAHAASAHGHADVVEWIYQHVRGAAHAIGIPCARAALSQGHASVVQALYLQNPTLFDAWDDALEMAARSESADVVEVLIRCGARYSRRVMLAAVETGSAAIVSCIALRFGADDLQWALDCLAAIPPAMGAIEWIAATYADICMANVYTIHWGSLTRTQNTNAQALPMLCQCQARCSPNSTMST